MADQLQQPMIVMTPPVQPDTSTSHPRRPPAHRSVSLLHSPRRKPPSPVKDASDSSSDSVVPASKATAGKGDSPSSLLPLGRDSSGESSNAEKWFEKSNNEVRDTSTTFADNEPPFFMRNSSSSETPPEAQQQMRQFLGIHDGANSLPMRTGLLHLGTDGSSTEDFRSVIDDLTIENKKLKRRLKKYEKLHDSHLRDEKLFEVRIHGLPAEKKRELEETLRKFASSLGTSGFPASGYEGLLPMLNTHKTASSQTSIHNTDSAYASMSMSGQGSNTHSGGESRHKQAPTSSARRQNTQSNHSNIHSYLHHIPEGLLPQQNPANMTERAKKKLVVRRLEQVFAGKGAAVGGHQHPIQQQEVSQSAARADRAESEAQGERARLEGNREAHILRAMKDERELNQDGDSREDLAHHQKGKENSGTLKRNPAKQEDEYNEQRPTRPLDLDPHRAQVPAENIRYMRHLGFSPPDPGNMPEDGHGWVYLNLLINMAQLHTINVTAEFVKKALTECSSKFELSEDGRKIRWKGGASITRTSSSGGASSTAGFTPDERSPRKRPKLAHRESAKSSHSLVQPGAKSQRAQSEQNKLMYTPLFFHRDSTDEAESSEEEDYSDESPYPMAAAGDSSNMTSSGVRTTSTKKQKKREDGPIIFYNNARFCTDLSGDRKTTGNANAPPYTTASALPVGKPLDAVKSNAPYEKRGPLAKASQLPEPMNLEDNPIPDSMELSFPQSSPLKDDPKHSLWRPMDMEVTGIGGVWPADHFAIAVESRQALVDQSTAPSASRDVYNKHIPDKFAQIFQEAGPSRKARVPVHHQKIVNTKQQILPPAELPPALSFMPFSEGSQGDDESDVDDEMSISPESVGGFAPSAAPQPVEIPYADSEEDEEDEYSEDGSDDGSLDLLAAAREVDPDAIRRQEREYDANMADRLAEEIPAGSSAATAGGGSGFASPAAGVNREEYRRAMREARAKRPAELERAKTTDSMKVQDPRESSSEDDDDDEDMDDAAS